MTRTKCKGKQSKAQKKQPKNAGSCQYRKSHRRYQQKAANEVDDQSPEDVMESFQNLKLEEKSKQDAWINNIPNKEVRERTKFIYSIICEYEATDGVDLFQICNITKRKNYKTVNFFAII